VVDGSLIATGITFMQPLLAERGVVPVVREQIGNAGFYSAPTDVYRAKDGWLVLQTIGDEMFERWARFVSREDLISDPALANDALRQQNRAVITAVMNEWLSTRTVDEAIAALNSARLPAGRVLSLDEAVADPHVVQTNLLRPMPYASEGQQFRIANTPVRLSATPGAVRHSAPALGAHTSEVLQELGFSESEIDRFREAEVV
jgi:crotonobetainyl-CoA:carnitine CoA-transferase CaiB-like acyl-CoA transferase